jgi:hypothetical protein
MSAGMFIYGDGGAVGGGVPCRGEDKIWGAGGFPPVASAQEAFGEAKIGRSAGSPLVAAGSFGVADGEAVGGAAGGPWSSGVCGRTSAHPSWIQNFASEVPTTLAGLRMGMKARHSAWQVGVMSSPFHMATMRVPPAVQPGYRPKEAQYRRGHSKVRWWCPGKADDMAHAQFRPGAEITKPKLFPIMSNEAGFPTKPGNTFGLALGRGAGV